MKKRIILILLLTLCFVFSGCAQKMSPFKEHEADAKMPRKFKVYVCGAVEREGFVEVEEGADYDAVIALAGIIPQTVYPTNPRLLVKEDGEVLTLQYYDGSSYRDCVNLNGGYIQYRLKVDGIDIDIINRIADYYDTHGKITDRNLLKDILGEDYQDNYYKFFVNVQDYEKVS
ncbi:MAG: hypothetical protein NC132_01430 [Corallococcus sp.]|nr:hypothetical protein [Corallococcus sp.]MCM1359426.1 hypothetical protein [Corallococcus sp.]MCM1394762.1 hypothetical protein [Corallococcus sp.]